MDAESVGFLMDGPFGEGVDVLFHLAGQKSAGSCGNS